MNQDQIGPKVPLLIFAAIFTSLGVIFSCMVLYVDLSPKYHPVVQHVQAPAASHQHAVVPIEKTEIKIEPDPKDRVSIGTYPVDDASLKRGKVMYANCLACHGPGGAGIPGLAPPLMNSPLVKGLPQVTVMIPLLGIKKANAKYAMMMTPIGASFSEEQLADVVTFIRWNWGNNASAVTADQVREWKKLYYQSWGGPLALTRDDFLKKQDTIK